MARDATAIGAQPALLDRARGAGAVADRRRHVRRLAPGLAGTLSQGREHDVTLLELLWAVPREGGNAGAIFIIQMLLIFGIFYFLLIRPQSKERQRHEQMLQKVKKGDEIVMNGGIIGKVVHVEEKRLTLKTGDNTRITVDRTRIAAVLDTRGEEQQDE